MLPSVSMAWLDAVGLRSTAVAGTTEDSRCGKRAVARHVVARVCCPAEVVVNFAVLWMVVNAVCGRPARSGWSCRVGTALGLGC